ncbi:polysaccharide biosynthesis tyrosine autokinase [Lentzea tibetensis]|uniref:Polysaccharide biosynthesis tyrosine autokinase n=1 Tax=Lentzea tibetensis TaxID=2591470 RepID=A0A563EXI5_9PSEU|nr:polysaccharide biosynthesis tyrosine autokinase [Lentzea tibetensis]TWP52416.1 polysaccharide biosynthesis tyrosine autokinase [Lentzea tibetensis]
MSLRGHLQVLRERWRLVVAGLLLGVAAAAAASWAVSPVYAAEVTLFVSAGDGNGDATQAYQGSLLSQQKVKSYTRLVTSGRIRQDLEHRGLAPGRDAVSAEVQPGTVLLTLTATDASPQQAQRLADAVAESFSRLVAELERPVDGGRPTVVVKVVEPAGLPTTPVSPRPVGTFALGLALGLVTGAGAALVRNALDTSVRSDDALRTLVAAPFLGSVPVDPGVRRHPVEFPVSARAEALRRIRTNLRFVDVDRPARTVVVTSSVPGEGKSTVVCDLAITLAEAGRTVVVVDADFHRPSIGEYTGLPSSVGLTSVLIGRVGLDQVLRPWGRAGVAVLTSGPIPPNPSELVASRHIADVLDLLAARFDVVLVDTPPLLPITDGAVLASRCDGAVLLVRHGSTTGKQASSSAGALEAVSARLLGTVLTMTPRSRIDDAYRYLRPPHLNAASLPQHGSSGTHV